MTHFDCLVLFVFLFAKRPGRAVGPLCQFTDIPEIKRINKRHFGYTDVEAVMS